MADLAIYANVAFRLLDVALDHREPKPGPDRAALGGEERFEHFAQVLRPEAASGCDREQDVLVGRHIAELPAIGFVEKRVRGLDGDLATFGLASRALTRRLTIAFSSWLASMNVGQSPLPWMVSIEIVSPTVSGQHAGKARDQSIQVDLLWGQGLLAGEREQALSQRSGGPRALRRRSDWAADCSCISRLDTRPKAAQPSRDCRSRWSSDC
jgi:hypothetical protein